MEKIVTIRSCCNIFFHLQMNQKLPNTELLKVTIPESFCERTIQPCKISQYEQYQNDFPIIIIGSC